MSENQFSIGLKISAIIAVILLIGIIVMAVYTIKSKNITASVLEDVPNANIVITDEENTYIEETNENTILTNEEEVEANIWEN
jgi:uncharacterized membrane protein